jgi:hypothetical protein
VANETGELMAKMKQEQKVEVVQSNAAAFRDIALPIVEKFAEKNCRAGLLDDIRRIGS